MSDSRDEDETRRASRDDGRARGRPAGQGRGGSGRRGDERGTGGADDGRRARNGDASGRPFRSDRSAAGGRRAEPGSDRGRPVSGGRPRRADGAPDRRPAAPGRERRDGDRGGFRRDASGGARLGGGQQPGRRSADRGGRFAGSDRPVRERRPGGERPEPRRDRDDHRAGPGRHVDEPQLPDEVRAADLDRAARAELRTLSKENADAVARHLVMAGRLIEVDPAEAHRHALAAGRRAGRVAVVRESVAITAYAVGDFALALRELRTFRRISGSDDQIGLMVDSERGVGRPDRALELGRGVDAAALPAEARVALAVAMSGARLDLGDAQGALDELERVPADLQRVHPWSPVLFAALASVHEDLGDGDAAALWARRADRAEALLDEVGEEGATVTVEELPAEDAPGSDER